uniref:Splicing factor YJU2 n=1 Tax=Timspurckia oligopyrenoides TaxID=708627 RepID=A0A7S0ZG58_9RHOD
MSERKVLNKYYPPDFDPSKVPREKRDKNAKELIRFMLPMTVRCSNCGQFMYVGSKFNVKKETVTNQTYHGIRIFRFFLKCVACANGFTILTDPKNADYRCEAGATRNYDRWNEKNEERNDAENAHESGGDDQKEKEDENDAVVALETKAARMKRKMEVLDELEELAAMSARRAQVVDIGGITKGSIGTTDNEITAVEDKEEEELVRQSKAAFAEEREKLRLRRSSLTAQKPRKSSRVERRNEASHAAPPLPIIVSVLKSTETVKPLDVNQNADCDSGHQQEEKPKSSSALQMIAELGSGYASSSSSSSS